MVEQEIGPAFDRQLARLVILASWEPLRGRVEPLKMLFSTFVRTARGSAQEPDALADVFPALSAALAEEQRVTQALAREFFADAC